MTRTIEALRLIDERKPGTYREFAKWFWPNSDMHTNHSNCGNGGRIGAGAFLCAGSFLGKLERRGLIRKNRDRIGTTEPIAYLTSKGRIRLEMLGKV